MITTRTGKTLRYLVGGALAASLVAGAATAGEDSSTRKAEAALSGGKVDRAIRLGEQAVEASPHSAPARLVLAQAYLKAGRFDAAATTFNDAMDLGDNSARTALSLALANTAAGRTREAVAILDDWRSAIPASDLGLAYALAGEPGRGVAILVDRLRSGENTPKLRQNLAYAYALDGRWREARLMMAEDVPAGQIDERISQWAQLSRPEDHQRRVASLLSVPVVADSGQPARLALSYPPAAEQLAVETATAQPEAVAAAPSPEAELPFGGAAATAAPSSSFASAFAGPEMVSNPVVQPLPGKPRAERPVRVAGSFRQQAEAPAALPARAVPVREDGTPVAPRASGGTHLVQLGSFSSEQGARRAWGIFTAKNPELRNYRMTITPAVVHGKNFWRVAAAGLNGAGASGLCSTVKGRGGACFAYAATNPPPSNVPARGTAAPQMARRR